jgi:hypothetical protein
LRAAELYHQEDTVRCLLKRRPDIPTEACGQALLRAAELYKEDTVVCLLERRPDIPKEACGQALLRAKADKLHRYPNKWTRDSIMFILQDY